MTTVSSDVVNAGMKRREVLDRLSEAMEAERKAYALASEAEYARKQLEEELAIILTAFRDEFTEMELDIISQM